MSRPSFGRTHVVDLGSMTREQLIDVAKKQATQIREKNIAIRSMEQLIESFTGDRQATARSGEGDVTSLPRASSRDWAGGDSPVAVAPPSSEASALTEELRALEARYYEAQGALAESTAAYDALTKKVSSWKETVMQTSQRDEQRIAQLEQQLAQTRHACAPASTQDAKLADLTVADVPAAVLDAAVQEKLSAWKERTKAALQAERDRVVELEQEVGALRAAAADAESRAGASAGADAALAAVRAELEASQAEVARAGAAAEAAQVESERTAAELVTARADADTARAELETAHSELAIARAELSAVRAALDEATAKLADLTVADVPAAVLDAAVQEKLSAWKERTKAALQAERDRVVELEQEVGALRAAAADAESRAGASAGADAALAAVRAELEASQAEVARAGAAAEAAQVESERTAAELVTARADADTARAELETAHSELESVRGAVSKRCSHENTFAEALRALHAHIGSLQGETGRLHQENAVLRNRVNDLLAFREAVQREVSNGMRQRESAGFVADRTVQLPGRCDVGGVPSDHSEL